MFIVNPEVIKDKISFNKRIGLYLANHGVPLLAIEGDKYYFANTDLLSKALKSLPLWAKLKVLLSP
jgi:hypothetical protein